MKTYDVIVVGAGPAGTACALAMKDSGLSVLVIDKNTFPRDKICGDAIPLTAVKALKLLHEDYVTALKELPTVHRLRSCEVVAPSGQAVTLHFTNEGHSSTRFNFDHFLLQLAERDSGARFITGEGVQRVVMTSDGAELTTTGGNIFHSRLIIGCDGAQSVVNKHLTTTRIDHDHYLGAVRAYYKNVSGGRPNTMEIHLLQGYMPGYFWIFPLADNMFNIGFGMVTSAIIAKKINVRTTLLEIINTHDRIKDRFKDAAPLESPIGYGLPTGSRIVQISGERFMLAGDAASLIDPATGEGIGNAMLSGVFAGQHAVRCFRENDFSAGFMEQYDALIHRKLRKDMRNKYYMQKIVGERDWIANSAIGLAANVPWIQKRLLKIF